jgi:alpha-N-arabinofuranosidase
MANLAQLINVLQALLLVEDDKCIKTPTYHVFDLYRPHKGAQAVRLLSVAETVSEGEASKELCRANYLDKRPFSLQALHGSASLSGDRLCVTLVNTHPSQPVELDLELHQGKLDEVEVVTLAAGDIHAHNTFDNPETVKLSEPQRHRMRGNRLPVPLAAASVTRIVGRVA